MDKSLERTLVENTTNILKLAKQVIDVLKAEDETPSYEQPTLSELVLIAQIIGQTSVIEKVYSVAKDASALAPPPSLSKGPECDESMGEVVAIGQIPDLTLTWVGDGWIIDAWDSESGVKVETMEDLTRAIAKTVAKLWTRRKGR